MKKFFSIVTFLTICLSLSSFTPSNLKSEENSDCVREARTLTLMESEAMGYDSPNDNWELMSKVYNYHYRQCFYR